MDYRSEKAAIIAGFVAKLHSLGRRAGRTLKIRYFFCL